MGEGSEESAGNAAGSELLTNLALGRNA